MNPEIGTFLLLLAAHVLGDVVVTSHRLALLKRSSRASRQVVGVALHGLVHGAAASLFLTLGGRSWLTGAVLVFVLHGLIDILRCRSDMKRFGPDRLFLSRSEIISRVSGRAGDLPEHKKKDVLPWLLTNLLDQAFHLASLGVITLLI